MEQLTQFIINHWLLSLALVLILALLLLQELKSKSGGNRLSVMDATQLINRENAVVLDIRDTELFADGHIVNAVNIPLTGLMQDLNKIKKYKDKPIILVCAAGQNSVSAMGKLNKEGYTRVYMLSGGLQSWKQAGLPLVKR